MAIIQQPDVLSLSGNLKKFIISSGGQISFSLMDGATTLIEATYEPGADGYITIDIKDIVVSRLSYLVSSNNFYEQPNIVKTFTATVDGTVITFKVIRAGVANLADTPTNWLQYNFLTWQPVNKQITYYSPEWLTYYAIQTCNIKLKAYFPDNTVQKINLGACAAGKAFTVNVQYSVIAGLLGQKYPSYYDVWIEDLTGNRLSYIQRYIYSDPKSEQEQWFLFENSLGGLDTLRTSGSTDFTGDHDHKLSTADDVIEEYQIDTTRSYNQNTGYLDEYERSWLLDFFPSKKKYVYFGSAIRSIVVSQSDVKYNSSDLPSSYSFVYRFTDQDSTALLNLIRYQDIPTDITLPDLSSPDFHLPPRLSEYPRVTLSEGVILPAFDPNSNTAQITTIGAMLTAFIDEILSLIQPGSGTGGGELVDVLRSLDLRSPSDQNVFSALRTLDEISKALKTEGKDQFLSKTIDDTAQGLITFVKGIIANELSKFLKGIEVGSFIPGMFNGKGANIDELGNAEMTSLRLRAMLETPELRYNRLTVIGDEFILTENGLIESVQLLVDRSYQLNMKLEEGEAIAFMAGDLVKGIFHHTGGFATSYMRVEEIGATFMKITLVADIDTPPNFNLSPQPFMNIARVGHITDANRQRYMVFSSKLGGYQLYDGCSDFLNGRLVASFDTAQSFKSLFGTLPLKEGLPYIYAAGLVVQDIIRVDYQGKNIREVYDRGIWVSGATYYNNDAQGTDDVWYLGCRWRCFSASTTEEPKWTSAAWYMVEGRSDARMEFDSSNGYAFFSGNVNTIITPIVLIGNTNVSDDIVNEQWSWSRESGDQAADDVWKINKGTGRLLTLQNEDMGTLWSRTNPVRFICTATYHASSINNITNYLEV